MNLSFYFGQNAGRENDADHNRIQTYFGIRIDEGRRKRKYPLIDADPQGDLTTCLGCMETDRLETTLATIMGAIVQRKQIPLESGILHHEEGMAFVPSNLELSAFEISLVTAMNRENISLQHCHAKYRPNGF